MQMLVHRDSKAWQVQVWASFLIAAFLCGVGLVWLPGKDLDKAFMVMGYLFCLSAAFVLAKYVRDSEKARLEPVQAADTPLFGLVVWGGFALAMGLTLWGLLRMEINETYKAFLAVGWLYLITCTFTLAKMLRDKHEADLIDARLRAGDHATTRPAVDKLRAAAPAAALAPHSGSATAASTSSPLSV